jgi:CRISPR/Cas system-associated protein Cas10 (large subunit of type III CRISPR-Cas system)
MSDKVKLVLTKPALDRLIGGDSELEVELKHAVAKELLENHIQPALRLQATQEISKRLREGFTEQLQEQLGEYKAGMVRNCYGTLSKGQVFNLHPDIKAAIEETVHGQIQSHVNEYVKTLNLEARIAAAFQAGVKQAISDGVRAKLKEVQDSIGK